MSTHLPRYLGTQLVAQSETLQFRLDRHNTSLGHIRRVEVAHEVVVESHEFHVDRHVDSLIDGMHTLATTLANGRPAVDVACEICFFPMKSIEVS